MRRAAFELVLGRARASVRNRENLRLARSRAFGLVKRLFRALGRKMAEMGVLEAAEDVFWLTVDEVIGAVRGHAITTNLRALVALRRDEYAVFATTRPASRLEARGLVAGAKLIAAAKPDTAPSDGEALHGLGCCPGVVRARAKVVLEPSHDARIDGEILVAPMTDPGWVFLMAAAGGLIVERGSLLSHTAIIGRELGIPTVVAVKDATTRIADGALVEIDGAAGTVRVVDQGDDS